MYKADYKDKLNKGVYVSSEKIKLKQSMNVDHWKIWLLNEI